MNVVKFSALPSFLLVGVFSTLNYSFSVFGFCGFVAVTALQFMYVTD